MSRRRSFTISREPITAELGGEEFHAPPVIAPAVLGEMVEAGARIQEIQTHKGLSQRDMLDQTMKVLDEVFGLVLVPESAERFHTRLFSRTDPLDLAREVMPALEWLIEEFTDRPTQPSPPSTTGPDDGGSSSTPGAWVEASTPNPSQPTDSATPFTLPSTN